jgi:zinc and cadmium transporter
VLIAAAFMQDVRLGLITALAIIAHEIPQEVGDFLILLHSGYSRLKALAFNLLSSLATLVGGLLAYFALSAVQGVVPVFLALAAASMIYVAVADLIPGLHKRTELRATLQQVLLIAAGVASIHLAHLPGRRAWPAERRSAPPACRPARGTGPAAPARRRGRSEHARR